MSTRNTSDIRRPFTDVRWGGLAFLGILIVLSLTASPAAAQTQTAECSGGLYYGTVDIEEAHTYPGLEVCGMGHELWICEPDSSNCDAAGGWCPEEGKCTIGNPRLGINTAGSYSSFPGYDRADVLNRAQRANMGWILDMQLWADTDTIVGALAQSVNDAPGITHVIRTCAGNFCGFADNENTADPRPDYEIFLQRLSEVLNGIASTNGSFYVIAGANEPDKENWLIATEIFEEGAPCECTENGSGYSCSEAESKTPERQACANAYVMNKMIDMRNQIPDDTSSNFSLKLLSPAFDCTNPNTRDIIGHMASHDARFAELDGMAFNTYNDVAASARDYLNACVNYFEPGVFPRPYDNGINAPVDHIVITEIGMMEYRYCGDPSQTGDLSANMPTFCQNIYWLGDWDGDGDPDNAPRCSNGSFPSYLPGRSDWCDGDGYMPREFALSNLRHQISLLLDDDRIEGILLFNSFGLNSDVQFHYNVMTDSELYYVIGHEKDSGTTGCIGCPLRFTHTIPLVRQVASDYGVRVVQNYANATHPDYFPRRHAGVDIEYDGVTTSANMPVHAAADGIVRFTLSTGYPGGVIVLEHDLAGQRLYTMYGHLGSFFVSNGQSVTRGQEIGTIAYQTSDDGSDNSHLHFEVRTWLYYPGNGSGPGSGYAQSGKHPSEEGWLDPIKMIYEERAPGLGAVTFTQQRNLRTGPSLAYTDIGLDVYPNTEYIVEDVAGDTSGHYWYKVRYDDVNTGWANAFFKGSYGSAVFAIETPRPCTPTPDLPDTGGHVTTLCGYPAPIPDGHIGPSIGVCEGVCSSMWTDGTCVDPVGSDTRIDVYGCPAKTSASGYACDGNTNNGTPITSFFNGESLSMTDIIDSNPQYCTFNFAVMRTGVAEPVDFLIWERDTCNPTPPPNCGSTCTQCVLEQRPDVLWNYGLWGHSTACSNRDWIVDDWCTNLDGDGCRDVKNNYCSVECGDDPPPDEPPDEPPEQGNSAVILSVIAPNTMEPGQVGDVAVMVQNNGSPTWSEGTLHRLGSHYPNGVQWTEYYGCGGYTNSASDNRANLCGQVAPGQTYGFIIGITAPSTLGTTYLNVQMVQDGVEWFGGIETRPIQIVSNTGCGTACTQCILAGRPDILPFYEDNGWDISCWNWDNIINNWCGIDPPGCQYEKEQHCPVECGISSCGDPCAECVIAVRPDLLPFYEMNGWNTACSNWGDIVNNWCSMPPPSTAPEDCMDIKGSVCSSACGTTSCGNPCEECVLSVRPGVLTSIVAWTGWANTCSNYPKIVNEWCTNLDPAACYDVKATSCSASCDPPPAPSITADFTATSTTGTAPHSVSFTDASAVVYTVITDWEWDFDSDGVVDATVANPSFTYQKPGNYTVTLTATDGTRSDSTSQINLVTVEVDPNLRADFTVDVTSGDAPLTVYFTDTAAAVNTTVSDWQWDFDSDGVVDSTDRDPVHTFTTPGTYNVTLAVSDGTLTDSLTRTGLVTADQPATLDAAFTSDVTSGYAPLVVNFSDTSVAINTAITDWEWDFDSDGGVDSTAQNPLNAFTAIGTYTVTLTVSNDTLTASTSRVIIVGTAQVFADGFESGDVSAWSSLVVAEP